MATLKNSSQAGARDISKNSGRNSSPHSSPPRNESVLVLKSRYDDIWNYFSAAKLGKTVTEYWAEWLECAERGDYSADPAHPFLPYDPSGHKIVDVQPDLFHTALGKDGEIKFTPNLGKIGLLGSRWIVSRKRNKNLFDLTTKWKNTVFDKLDEIIVKDNLTNVSTDSTLDQWLGLPADRRTGKSNADSGQVHLHSRDSDDAMEHPTFGRLLKIYSCGQSKSTN